jgi:succinyl-diaminopimelate desuccinylase
MLERAGHLTVERIGDNVVATTPSRHGRRVIIAGHLDTVPGNVSLMKRTDLLVQGLGASDMKGSLAVMLELACDPSPRRYDLTWVFYAREEIARSESGLVELAELRPDLLAGDVALVCEPTGGAVEAGCQGSLRVEVVLKGARAHTSRPFTGRNAIHRMGDVLAAVARYEPRISVLDDIAYTEQLQAVHVSGGVANNVVPDEARCVLNYRVAPDQDLESAVSRLRTIIGETLEDEDHLTVQDWAPPAPPSLHDPLLHELVGLTNRAPRAKVGWTDVATFFERGVPAANFGAADPLRAHQIDEFVTEEELDEFALVLRALLLQ